MDNEKKLWFKAKRYGWGWKPISWQGWVLTFIYVAGLVHFAIDANKQHSVSNFLINYGFDFVVLSTPYIIICYLKGEHPHWRPYWRTEDKNATQAQQQSDTINKV